MNIQAVMLLSRSVEGRVFPFSCRRLGRSLQETIVSSFLKFLTSSQNAEIGLSEVIKVCTRKLINRTHFMSPLKMINLFQDMMPNFSPQNVGLEVLRLAIFMINRTQMKPKNQVLYVKKTQSKPLHFCWRVEKKWGKGGLP